MKGRSGLIDLWPGDPVDRFVRHVPFENVVFLADPRFDRSVVLKHHRLKAIGVRSHETEIVREAFTAWPTCEWPNLRDFIEWGVVPFADGIVHVAGLLKMDRDRLTGLRNHRVVARKAHGG